MIFRGDPMGILWGDGMGYPGKRFGMTAFNSLRGHL